MVTEKKELREYIYKFFGRKEIRNIIYALIDPNTTEVRYVGMTYEPARRYVQHHSPDMLQSESYHDRWMRKIINNNQKVEMKLLEEFHSYEELEEAETFWIDYYASIGADLTNSRDYKKPGKLTEETKQKLSKRFTGEGNPFFNRNHTEESIKKISEALSGENNPNYNKPRSEETKKRIGDAQRGEKHRLFNKNHPPETIERMKQWQKDHPMSDEEKQRYSEMFSGENNPNFGLKRSEETIRRLSESHKGQKAWNKGISPSAETCKKISDNNPNKTSNEIVEKMKLLRAEGKEYREIGEILNCSASVVCKYLKPAEDEKLQQEIVEMKKMRELGKTYKEIGEMLGHERHAVSRWLKKN